MLGVRGSRGEGLTFCRSTEHHTAHFRLMWREKSSLNLNELVKVAFAKEWQGRVNLLVNQLFAVSAFALPFTSGAAGCD